MPHSSLKDLPAQIQQELQCSERLLQALRREQALLTGMQLDELPEQAARKQQALDALQQATGHRLRSLRQAGFDSLEALGRALRLPDGLRRKIHQLQQAIEQAQKLNQQNGLLIQRGMQVNQQLLYLLGGQSPAETGLYQPGQAPANGPSALLGEA